MIERFLEKLIEELGATGLLILGLYWLLYQPLRQISRYMGNVNKELGEIRNCIKKETDEEHDKMG